MYNHKLQSFYQTYGEHILINLCKDYHKYFSFNLKEKSKISNHILDYDLSDIIKNVCHNLVKNGEHTIHYKLENDEDYTFIKFTSKPISENKIHFVFPSSIMSNYKRKKTIRKLKKLNSNQLYNDGLEGVRFISNMKEIADIEVSKLGKHFFIFDYNWSDYYTDYYYVYRKIRQMLEQRKLVDYVLEVINLNLVNIFKLDKSDIILFNGITIDILNKLLDDLKQNNKSVATVLNELYK